MKNKSKNNKALLLIPVFLIIGVAFLMIPSESDVYSQVAEFSFAPNYSMNCKTWTEGQEVGTNGVKDDKTYATKEFKPLIQYDVTSLHSSIGKLQKITAEVHVACESTSTSFKDFTLKSASVSQSWYAIDTYTGKQTFLKSATCNPTGLPANVLFPSKEGIAGTTVCKSSISASEIDAKLSSTKSDYSTKITVITKPSYHFSSTATNNDQTSPAISLTFVKVVKIHNDVVDPAPTYTPPPSTSYIPLSNDVKLYKLTADNGKSWNSANSLPLHFDVTGYPSTKVNMKIEGLLPEWKSVEGNPTITVKKLTATSSLQTIVNKQTMASPVLFSSSSNQYKFTTYVPMSLSGIEGHYVFEMHSNNDVRKGTTSIANWNMIIEKSSIVNPTTKICNGVQIPIADTCTTSPTSVTSTTAYYQHTETYSNGKYDSAKSNAINVNLSGFSFIDAIANDADKKLQYLTWYMVMDLTGKGVTSSDPILDTQQSYAYSIFVNDVEKIHKAPFNAQQLTKANKLTSANNNYLFATVVTDVYTGIMKPLQLEGYAENCSKIHEAEGVCNFLPDGTKIKYVVTSTAKVGLTANGQHVNGIVSGLTYSLDFLYNTPSTQEKCQTVTGAQLSECNNTDTDGDGIIDSNDKCPTIDGKGSSDGCPKIACESTSEGCGGKDGVDSDGDGVIDINDFCPLIPAFTSNGCPPPPDTTDTDGDKIPDVSDHCPTEKGSIQNNGCPVPPVVTDLDSDGDGIIDVMDSCPTVIGVYPDGCPPKASIDSDKDGFPDSIDECPTVIGVIEYNGCPPNDGGLGGKGSGGNDGTSGLCPDGLSIIECIKTIQGGNSGLSPDLIVVGLVVLVAIIFIVILMMNKKRNG